MTQLKQDPISALQAELNDTNETVIQLYEMVRKLDDTRQISDPKLVGLMRGVEYYEPLYNAPYFVPHAPQRICWDRAHAIFNALKDRPAKFKVLNVGCSLGFFDYFMAERNCHMHGIDAHHQNILICEYIRNYNHMPIQPTFEQAMFDQEYVAQIDHNQYDGIFMLSVVHHLIYQRGLEYVQDLMVEILEKFDFCILELCQKTEQPYIHTIPELPANDLDILAKCDDIKIDYLGHFSTHLSQIRRPIYLASKSVFYMNGKAHRVLSRTSKPHQLSNRELVDYLFTETEMIKRYHLKDQSRSFKEMSPNLGAILNDLNVNIKLHTIDNFPKLLDYEFHPNYVALKFERLTAYNLASENPASFNVQHIKSILMDMCLQLKFLLALKLYHNDLRIWNILTDGKKAALIDFGFTDTQELEETRIALIHLLKDLHMPYENKQFPLKTIPDFTPYPAYKKLLDFLKIEQPLEAVLDGMVGLLT